MKDTLDGFTAGVFVALTGVVLVFGFLEVVLGDAPVYRPLTAAGCLNARGIVTNVPDGTGAKALCLKGGSYWPLSSGGFLVHR